MVASALGPACREQQTLALVDEHFPSLFKSVACYLAAHSPTERAALETADIARRLMRGGELHQEAGGFVTRRRPENQLQLRYRRLSYEGHLAVEEDL